jgi:hypothetical protein
MMRPYWQRSPYVPPAKKVDNGRNAIAAAYVKAQQLRRVIS